MDIGIIFVISGFLIGVGLFLKGKSGQLKKLSIKDRMLMQDELSARREIEKIKKELAEKETGKTMTPDEIEEYWKKQ